MNELPLFLSPAAEADLEQLADWISDQGAPIAALHYVQRVRNGLAVLGRFPARGRSLSERRKSLRFLPVERSVVVYEIQHESIVILRVFHGGQDWQAVLQEPDVPGA